MGKILPLRGMRWPSPTRWLLVANRVRASIYAMDVHGRLQFLRRLHNPQGKFSESELGSDRPGRATTAGGPNMEKHALESRTSAHEQVAMNFAKRIVRFLKKAEHEGEFGQLVWMAEPHFLGILKKNLAKPLREKLLLEIRREWTKGSDAELEDFVGKKIWQTHASR